METESALRSRVGHPGEKWDALIQRVQATHVRMFSEVEPDWLDLMWTLDAYRAAGLPPDGMGDQRKAPGKRLAAVYRGKGNWFATLLALLLENQSSHRLAPRVRVQGFSQTHQIDVAWPDREVDPLVCLETKVTGAPATPTDPARGAMADWTNRRKELKFAATDLKLFRRQHLTSIEHWDVWRGSVFPKTYFLWAARLRPADSVERMVTEAQALVKTYLEGAGIVAWREGVHGYVGLPVPPADRISTVDDVLYRVATEIRMIAPPGSAPPPPEMPPARTIDVEQLEGDTSAADGG
ncbi:MAG: hypothetical protein QOK43_2897 [Acidimicrobiaceae bacterium]|nr:hypothetical protein [Acidimicrobiaceae bacterium]